MTAENIPMDAKYINKLLNWYDINDIEKFNGDFSKELINMEEFTKETARIKKVVD